MALVTFGNGARVLDADAVQPRLRQEPADQPTSPTRCRAAAPRWSKASTAAGTNCGRCPRPAVGPARHRAVHRRRLEQRAGHLRRHAGHRARAPDVRLPEATLRTPTARRGTTRRSRGCTTRRRAASPTRRYSVHGHATGTTPTTLPRRATTCRSTSCHAPSRSCGIPTTFPLQTSTLTVNGVPQIARDAGCGTSTRQRAVSGRGLEHQQRGAESGRDHRQRGARATTATTAIRIYTIGMGELVRYNLGTMPEKSERHPDARRQRHALARLQQRRSSKASTTSRRRRLTWARRSRRCRTRSSG